VVRPNGYLNKLNSVYRVKTLKKITLRAAEEDVCG